MTKPLRDHRNRPVVAVTGIGMISSLGVGMGENWAAVTAGRSGVHRITRFPITHLRTTIAGTIDYLPGEVQGFTLAAGELAGDEAVTMSGLGKPGDFPGPLFTAIPPVEMEWTLRRRLYDAADPSIEDAYDRMIAVARRPTTMRNTSSSCTAMSARSSPSASAPRARRSR